PRRLRAGLTPQPWLIGAESDDRKTIDRDLDELLRRQLLETSLPSLLRYEDRASMAWSVESRVPFLDYRVVEFLAGLPYGAKVHRGTTKNVLRIAMKGVLPEPVRCRTDKMGFVTPEETWLKRSATNWFREGVENALGLAPELLNAAK